MAHGETSLDLPYLRVKARATAERAFTPSFRLRLAAATPSTHATGRRVRDLSITPAKLLR
jgi:hypothetical protein